MRTSRIFFGMAGLMVATILGLIVGVVSQEVGLMFCLGGVFVVLIVEAVYTASIEEELNKD